jgi:hypothetical protein
VHLQLLASSFYEAVKREIGRTPACEAERDVLLQLRRTNAGVRRLAV